MTRGRRADGQDHFDLLPFIAILMCVLGCLLLVTMSVAALSLGPGLGEGWVPSNDRKGSRKPLLIEWDGKIAVVHLPGSKSRVEWPIDTFAAASPEAGDVLNRLALRKSTWYALFAVRPSGFDTFEKVADDFRRRGIVIGYEPIPQEKSVRLLAERTQK